jgi:hypothetical protein
VLRTRSNREITRLTAEISQSLAEFLNEPFVAIVGTKRKNGTVQLTPAWFELRDGQIWLNSWRGSDWARHIEEQGIATLLVADPADAHRSAEIVARLIESTDEGGREHIEALSQRYTGGPYRFVAHQQRFTLKLEPTRIKSRV